QLYPPVVQPLVYNYALTNVESQLAQSRALLHWVRNVIHVRKAHPVFGLGSITVLETDNPAVLAFVRSFSGESQRFGDSAEDVLCVFSFAHNPVSVAIKAGQHGGSALYDPSGGAEIASVADDGTGTRTLATQTFYWLHVGTPTHAGGRPLGEGVRSS